MILRRIKAHIEKENWFAVFIDFCIVVIGVFIGIQVANWNEARVQAALEQALLESLQGDFEAIVTGDQERFERTLNAPNNLAVLINAIRLDEQPEDEVVWAGLEAAILAYAPTPPSPTFDELKSSGRLSQLKNRNLRRQLANFERSLFNEERWATHLITSSFDAPLYSHIDLTTSDQGFGLDGSYRWEGIVQTLPYLQQRLNFLHAQANWRRNSQERAEDILWLMEGDLE